MQTSPAPRPILTALIGGACLVLSVLMGSGCGEKIDSNSADVDGEPAIAHPVVERDLPRIIKTGTLRMVTYYNPRSYFIHRGGQAGFDYELLLWFARSQGLNLEVVIPEPGQDAISMVNAGDGDVLCTGQMPGPNWDRWLAGTVPTNFVQKVVILPASAAPPSGLEQLEGLTLTLPRDDHFKTRLQELRAERGVGFFISEAPSDVGLEELFIQLSRGQLQAVVADDIAARAAMAYLPDLHIGLYLDRRRPTVWHTRQNSPELKAALDTFLRDHLRVTADGGTRRSQTYGIIYDRYFADAKAIKRFREAAHRPDKSGRISIFDDLIRSQAEAAGLDWRMVAALIYQESRFYPYALSKAGAKGLMQVMPKFAGDQADSLFYPEANLRAGLRLMKATYSSYAYLDSLARWRFTLAEYHAGNGHVTDARRLAMDFGRNPNRWEGSLSVTLPLLMQRRYFDRMRHGYYGGGETVKYVEETINRYRMYTRLLPRYPVVEPDSLVAAAGDTVVMDPADLPDIIDAGPPPE